GRGGGLGRRRGRPARPRAASPRRPRRTPSFRADPGTRRASREAPPRPFSRIRPAPSRRASTRSAAAPALAPGPWARAGPAGFRCRRRGREAEGTWMAPPGLRVPGSDRQDLLFLALQQLVDFGDLPIRELLGLLEAAPLVVLRDLLVLEHLLQPVVALVTEATDLHPRFFGHVVRLLGEVLSPLFGQRGNRDADNLPVALRVQAQLRLSDRALDLPRHLR